MAEGIQAFRLTDTPLNGEYVDTDLRTGRRMFGDLLSHLMYLYGYVDPLNVYYDRKQIEAHVSQTALQLVKAPLSIQAGAQLEYHEFLLRRTHGHTDYAALANQAIERANASLVQSTQAENPKE